ncbi:Arylsulfatase [compost metagenome]
MNRPNIVFIMCDQLRHDSIGCNGNSIVSTPHIDRLAQSGINFTNSFTPNPICVPARASLTTGLYPHKCTGHKDNSGAIKEGLPTLGEELSKRGYDTYSIGKLHYNPYMGPEEPRTTHGIHTTEFAESGRILSKFDPNHQLLGLEDYHDYLHSVGWGGYTRGHGLGNNDVYPAPSPIPQEHYVDTWVADRAIAHMQNHVDTKKEAPFFMWVSFPKPHSAFDPPRPYDSLYDPRNMPEPIGTIDILKDRDLDQEVMSHYTHMWDLLSPEAKKVIKAFYYGLISHQDAQIGKILNFIETNSLQSNTIVIYTSDHGEMLGDFGLYFKKNFYNGSVRIPLIISYPQKIRAGITSEQLVGLQDLLPTLLGLIDDPLETQVDGKDLAPVIFEDRPVRSYYISQCGDDPHQSYMIISGCWKYIYHQNGGVEELYDQLQDFAELCNLARSSEPIVQEIRAQMRKNLIRWCTENEDDSMLENGELKQENRSPIVNWPSPPNPFGRRLY